MRCILCGLDYNCKDIKMLPPHSHNLKLDLITELESTTRNTKSEDSILTMYIDGRRSFKVPRLNFLLTFHSLRTVNGKH